jgi:cytochrome c oxidase subunit 2
MQDIAWYLSLICIGLLALIFLIFISSSRTSQVYEEVARRDYAHRGKLFWLAIIAGVFITMTTLLPWPHSVSANNPATRIVQVTASQWHWDLSEQKFHVGDAVEFQVTSKDVNHGFALYDDNMTMLGQIQAMPGYTNSLFHIFDKPGKYHILCLEYCGVAHHNMRANLTVLPAPN